MDWLSADLSDCYRIERELAGGGGTGQPARAQIVWLRVLVEGVVIVSAILLVFGPQGRFAGIWL